MLARNKIININIFFTVILDFGFVIGSVINDKITDINVAKQFLTDFDLGAEDVYYSYSSSYWNYNTNLTKYNLNISIEKALERAEYLKLAAKNTSRFAWETFEDENVKRQFEKIADAGSSILPEKDSERLEVILGDLEAIYSKATVCNKPGDTSGKCYPLDPDLTAIIRTSNDPDELAWAWNGWREVSGKKMKDQYVELVQLLNKTALMLGHSNAATWWQSAYDDLEFEKEMEKLWNQLKPLYQHLHAYVRRKLKETYGDKYKFPESGHIPAHFLGDMWAQQWSLPKSAFPDPEAETLDVTAALNQQNYTALKMFQTSEEFFTSLGLAPMPQPFWDHSMIEKPNDGRDVVCHASAWDFYNKKDFRIKMCTVITTTDLTTIHHEMGHVQYYLQYKHLPIKFRRGGNPGFHEAIGDVMALSVTTPEHMHKIGLIDSLVQDKGYDLNFLMLMALDKIAFLPFGYLVDQWRWSVFKGETPPEKYNSKWWDLRCNIQGMSPPDPRTEAQFDAAAKYHIPANTPYIRYFVSFVIQFQFHKALCEAAGHTGPLHRCDIYNSQEAGQKLKKMLSLGSSKPWQDAMEVITGQRKMDARPLVEYFQPIIDWLEKENGEDFGWDESGCPKDSFVASGSNRLYRSKSSVICMHLLMAVISVYFQQKIL